MCRHKDEFERLNTRVYLISFTTDKDFAKDWLKYTCQDFTLIFDPERKAYHAFNLQRSLLRSWSLKTLARYVKLMMQGRKWHGIQDDSAQLGGNIIIDRSGRLSLVHPSHDPTDRPSADELLIILKQLSDG